MHLIVYKSLYVNEPRPLPHTIHKHYFETDQRLKCKFQTIKLLRKITGENIYNFAVGRYFETQKSLTIKEKLINLIFPK